jgi:acyl-CoA thioester hydrolase
MAFVNTASVHFDELDAMHMLHNARFFLHMERTATALFMSLGRRCESAAAKNPDLFAVVKAQEIEYLVPFRGTGEMRVEMLVENVGRTSCTLAFRFMSPDQSVLYARGTRTIVKVSSETLRPTPWTEGFQDAVRALVADEEVVHAGV